MSRCEEGIDILFFDHRSLQLGVIGLYFVTLRVQRPCRKKFAVHTQHRFFKIKIKMIGHGKILISIFFFET